MKATTKTATKFLIDYQNSIIQEAKQELDKAQSAYDQCLSNNKIEENNYKSVLHLAILHLNRQTKIYNQISECISDELRQEVINDNNSKKDYHIKSIEELAMDNKYLNDE